MANEVKHNKILDALQVLLRDKEIGSITVEEIAKKSGMGKGSIYYYFPSKDAILEALIERNYKKPIETAKNLQSKPMHHLSHGWRRYFRCAEAHLPYFTFQIHKQGLRVLRKCT